MIAINQKAKINSLYLRQTLDVLKQILPMFFKIFRNFNNLGE